MCTGAILLYRIPRVVIGENTNFRGDEDLLRSRGVEVVVLDDAECKELMKNFIRDKPEVSLSVYLHLHTMHRFRDRTGTKTLASPFESAPRLFLLNVYSDIMTEAKNEIKRLPLTNSELLLRLDKTGSAAASDPNSCKQWSF